MPPPDSPRFGPRPAGRMRPAHRLRLGLSSCSVSPSYTLGRCCPLLRAEVGPGAGGPAPEWHHLLIGLYHTGRADTTRFKRDANLPRGETWACSTCHDGLLAAVMEAAPGGSPSGAGLPEIRPHSRVVVVRVEYSSKTLAPGLPLCRKCNY